MSPSRGALGWGVALVAIGVVLLLRATEVVPETVSAWPWALVGAGAALLLHPAGRRQGERLLPVVLVSVGGVFALRDTGVLPSLPLAPVLLIVAGVTLLAAGLSRRSPLETQDLALDLGDATSARVRLDYGAGTLEVRSGAGAGLLCEGTFAGGVRQDLTHTADRLDLTLRPPRDIDRLFWARHRFDWDLRLSASVPLDLEVHSGASQVHLDLSALTVRSLSVQTGASQVEVLLPARGHTRVDIDAGAAEVRVRVPEGVAAAVRTSSALASIDVDERRFPRSNGGYRSADYADAIDRADIDIEGGVASFSVR